MKFLAVILSAYIFLLSSFPGVAATAKPCAKKAGCHRMMAMKNSCPKAKDHRSQNGCNKMACEMMFLCSMCGIVLPQPLILKPALAVYPTKPVSLYKIGDLSAYHSSNWKPPKV
ncbi:hypothetical protein BH09BAC6_BH09BAC6_03500 [soil metagenome]|jgi:hypothetical protein